jgi:hypothetical protein
MRDFLHYHHTQVCWGDKQLAAELAAIQARMIQTGL